jgi:hypothetical protein
MTEYYEPWQPKEGDRVKIRVSSECTFSCPNKCDWHDKRQEGIGTVLPYNNKTSQHFKCRREHNGCGTTFNGSQGHYYAVELLDKTFYKSGWFAAIELELIQEGEIK